MLKIIEERKNEQKNRFEIAKAYAQKLSFSIGKVTAIIYGSSVRGDFKDYSDIDIVIIAQALPSDPMQRLDLLYSYSEGMIEPKGFILNEFRDMMASPFGRLLKKEGVVINDELNLFKDVKRVARIKGIRI